MNNSKVKGAFVYGHDCCQNYITTFKLQCVCPCFSVWLLSLLQGNLGSSKNFIWYLFCFASRLWVISVHSRGLVEIKPELVVFTHYDEYIDFFPSQITHTKQCFYLQNIFVEHAWAHVAWFPCCWCLVVITSSGEKSWIFCSLRLCHCHF